MSRDPCPFRSILVPLDGSPLAEQAVPLGARIAEEAGSTLRLALVHQTPPPNPDAAGLFASVESATRESEQGYLHAMEAKLRERGRRVSSAVMLTGEGGPGPALVEYVRQMDIDLVVMATHGRGGIRRAWLGSVADHLIRNLEVPVLLVRQHEGEPPAADHSVGAGRILVPLDGSPLAEEALDAAASFARIWGTQLTLLQVVRPALASTDSAFSLRSDYDEGLTAVCRAQAQEYLDEVVDRLHGHGVGASGTAILGWNVADSILEAARPDGVALVVIATHGRSGLGRLVLGSVADELVRGAQVPVLVWRGMQAQQKVARHVEAIARTLAQGSE
jgi:nucleotide-binding universal stress UspA family protein